MPRTLVRTSSGIGQRALRFQFVFVGLFIALILCAGSPGVAQSPPAAGRLEFPDKSRILTPDNVSKNPLFRMQLALPQGVTKPKSDPTASIEIVEDVNKYKPFYVNFSGDASTTSSITQNYSLLVIDVSGSMKGAR